MFTSTLDFTFENENHIENKGLGEKNIIMFSFQTIHQ